MEKTIFVVGAGKGLGSAVARRFAENGFHAVLMCRSAEHLAEHQKEMQAAGFHADTQVIDASDRTGLAAAMAQAVQTFGVPDVLFYNVGMTMPDRELPGGAGIDAELMQRRYQMDVLGAYTCIRQVLNEEFRRKQGAILITGGGLSLHPSADYLPLSMDKAALRAMVLALHPVCQAQGVFLGSVQVCDAIGGSPKYEPAKIADQFWKLYQDRTDAEIIY